MASKKKKKTEPVAEQQEVADDEPVEAGPSETTKAKGADEVWHCPHCDTVYRKDMLVAQRNHLDRVHHGLK